MTDRDRLGADSLREIREDAYGAAVERAEESLRVEHRTDEPVERSAEAWRSRSRLLARDVLALVAEREALLERIQELESGGSAAARSGGDS